MSQDARLDEERSTQRRAQILGLDYTDTSAITEKQLYPNILSVPEMYQIKIVPIKADQYHIQFGITNTTAHQMMQQLTQRFQDQKVTFAMISDTGYRDYMKLYDPPKKIVYQDIELNTAGSEDLFTQISATLDQVRADDMLAYLVKQAHRLNASDIHIENQQEAVKIRFRIDGVLHPIAKLSHDKYRTLRSAIASVGNISTSANDAQQGHIAEKLRMADGSEVLINLRLETVPTIHGMDMVMRLFNMEQDMYNLDRLGLSQTERGVVDDIIHRPTGLVLAVGPTGSGKTTTLYSMLNTLNSEDRKIITIEDPVEYQFTGITQISVTSEGIDDTSFAEKLRAVLRLDPDVVMVGEIRDADTAKTSLQAALTGHLVLSTFHASSSAAALTRLVDLIGENPLFVSAIRLVMAQRLVRRLNDNTKQEYQPDEPTMNKIKEIVESLPEGIEKPNIENLKLYNPGTSEENPYGFSGQMAIREQFLMTGEIGQLMKKGRNLTAQEIESAAIKSGMRTMLQDGILKVIAGQTTLQEIFRVLG